MKGPRGEGGWLLTQRRREGHVAVSETSRTRSGSTDQWKDKNGPRG